MSLEQIFLAFYGAAILFLGAVQASSSEVTAGPHPPRQLSCEYLKNPMGIDVKKPRFSWVLDHSERGQNQTAYQLIVSTNPSAEIPHVWDSGKIVSDQSIHVVYEGKALENDRTYYWKVRYWDKNNTPSAYSRIARFDTGLFYPGDWNAEWIGGYNQLRKDLLLESKVIRARAYICGLGYYELRLNGKKVGLNVLDPGYTTYKKRVLYSTYDIASMLQQGENTAAVMLGKGWSTARIMILQMNIVLESGERITVVSDSTWQGKDGPIVSDSVYNGEVYDARLETPGWDMPGFDGSSWNPVETGVKPKGILSAQMVQPIRVMDTIVPLEITQPEEGVYVFDMGQNFSGWAELHVSGPRGTNVRLRYAELLYKNGMINQENLRSAKAQDIYVLKGEDEEVYEPRFTYHGFRYVELTGFPGVPTQKTIRGRVVHTSIQQKGNFSCSHSVLNRLQHLIIWGQKTNLHSIPTDCNQRDERMGWLGDAHLTAEAAMMNFDMGAFYTKFIRDIRDIQDKEGAITDTVPHIWGRRPADPAWGTAYPLLCWYMYQYYGDQRILEDHYEGLKKYVEFLETKAEDGLVKYSYYGDWVAIEKAPGNLVSSFYYYYDVKILANIAGVLGYADEEKQYQELAAKIKKAFHDEYFETESKSYTSGTQTANTLALFLDLVPEDSKEEVLECLRNDIIYSHDTHLTTGIIGTKYLMEVLSKHNAAHLAYDLATQTTYPSWGHMIFNGATTLWELWQHRTGPSMNSHNHPMFGSVGAWFYKALVGIKNVKNSAGFRHLQIAPQMVRDLRYAAGTVLTPRGPVTSAWTRSNRAIRLEASIPVNTDAQVILPKLGKKNVILKESGKQIFDGQKFLTGIEGIRMVEEGPDAVAIEIGSGSYSFALIGD
jgi:alpha-L-rhamnosidase